MYTDRRSEVNICLFRHEDEKIRKGRRRAQLLMMDGSGREMKILSVSE